MSTAGHDDEGSGGNAGVEGIDTEPVLPENDESEADQGHGTKHWYEEALTDQEGELLASLAAQNCALERGRSKMSKDKMIDEVKLRARKRKRTLDKGESLKGGKNPEFWRKLLTASRKEDNAPLEGTGNIVTTPVPPKKQGTLQRSKDVERSSKQPHRDVVWLLKEDDTGETEEAAIGHNLSLLSSSTNGAFSVLFPHTQGNGSLLVRNAVAVALSHGLFTQGRVVTELAWQQALQDGRVNRIISRDQPFPGGPQPPPQHTTPGYVTPIPGYTMPSAVPDHRLTPEEFNKLAGSSIDEAIKAGIYGIMHVETKRRMVVDAIRMTANRPEDKRWDEFLLMVRPVLR